VIERGAARSRCLPPPERRAERLRLAAVRASGQQAVRPNFSGTDDGQASVLARLASPPSHLRGGNSGLPSYNLAPAAFPPPERRAEPPRLAAGAVRGRKAARARLTVRCPSFSPRRRKARMSHRRPTAAAKPDCQGRPQHRS